MKHFGLTALGGAAALVLGLLWARPLSRATLPPRLSVAPLQLMADGYDTATLTIDEPSPVAPAHCDRTRARRNGAGRRPLPIVAGRRRFAPA